MSKEIEELYQTCLQFFFDGGDCRIGFSKFDSEGKPSFFGMDDLKCNIFGRSIEYSKEKERWEIVNDCDEVEAWSDFPQPHPHLPPEKWYTSIESPNGWPDDPKVNKLCIEENSFVSYYISHAIPMMRVWSKKYDIPPC